jgi:CheY-like chemotaxis protein
VQTDKDDLTTGVEPGPYIEIKVSDTGIGIPQEIIKSIFHRILFVDDEFPIAKMGGQILERLGYSVTTRTSSIEALELFQNKPNDFDLVIMDMTLPNLTGDKLAVELLKIRRNIPIILCIGYSKKISDEAASSIGIKAFAFKPMVKADLAKTVRKVLDEAKSNYQE